MNIVGVSVATEIIQEVSESFQMFFGDIPGHWRRDVFDSSVLVLIGGAELKTHPAIAVSKYHYYYCIDPTEVCDLDQVMVDLMVVYLGVLVNSSAQVKRVFDETLQYLNLRYERFMWALVIWFMSKEEASLHISADAFRACEEIDRQLRGIYTPKEREGLRVM